MKNPIRSPALLLAALALIAVLGAAVAFAENMDPYGVGDQYAWGENVGWLNAEPANCSDCGVQVTDSNLTGYMWGENIGWVNMSCQNNGTCGGPAGNWGATNDGAGNLSGYAWGENVGWISFSDDDPVTYGVTINPVTGVFSGNAWGENIGWITFSDDDPVEYGVVTSWSGPRPVGGMAELPDVAGSSGPNYAVLAALGAAALLALTAGAWYARRRWVR